MKSLSPALPRLNLTQRLSDYWELTKPGIAGVAALMAFFGFFLGSPGGKFQGALLFHTLLGMALLAAGAGALNMLLEMEPDSLMQRTCNRPLCRGRIPAHEAFFLGAFSASLGVVHLSFSVGILPGFLGAVSLILYLVLYTPMKKTSAFCTVVGSAAGALPPLIGFSASAGRLDASALSLFAILFLWQFPHLMSLAWLYREDYSKAGFKLVPLPDEDGSRSGSLSLSLTVLLAAASFLPYFQGIAGQGIAGGLYLCFAGILNAALLRRSLLFYRKRDRSSARRLFLATILYAPLLLAGMVLAGPWGF